MQIGQVGGIRSVFYPLKPIAIVCLTELSVSSLGNSIPIPDKDVVAGQGRGAFLFRSQVAEDKAAEFLYRVPVLAELIGRFDGLRGAVENPSLPADVPTMIGTPDAMLLEPSILKRRPSVRAVAVQKGQMPGEISKEHKLLSQNFDWHRDVFNLFRQSQGPPESPQVVATQGSWSNPNHIIP